MENPNHKAFGPFFRITHQLWLSAVHLPQRGAVQEGRTQALSPWETLESHCFFPSETLDTSFPLHNHKKSHPGGILFPPLSIIDDIHRRRKPQVLQGSHVCFVPSEHSEQTCPCKPLQCTQKQPHATSAHSPRRKSGKLFPKNMQNWLFSGSWVVSSLPAQASGRVGPRHTPPKHSLSRHQKLNSSGSQTWASWLSSPSPEA